jgi:hypothetical protein
VPAGRSKTLGTSARGCTPGRRWRGEESKRSLVSGAPLGLGRGRCPLSLSVAADAASAAQPKAPVDSVAVPRLRLPRSAGGYAPNQLPIDAWSYPATEPARNPGRPRQALDLGLASSAYARADRCWFTAATGPGTGTKLLTNSSPAPPRLSAREPRRSPLPAPACHSSHFPGRAQRFNDLRHLGLVRVLGQLRSCRAFWWTHLWL